MEKDSRSHLARRHHARLPAGGPAADGQLLRGRAPGLRPLRRLHLRPLRGGVLLVAESIRHAARRAPGPAAFLVDADRVQHHVLPYAFPGLLGMPRRIYTYAPDLGWNARNLLSTAGAFLIAAS